MKEEANLVIYFYLATGALIVFFTIVILAFRQFKHTLNELSIFVKLMIGLYEQEKQKNERRDDSF